MPLAQRPEPFAPRRIGRQHRVTHRGERGDRRGQLIGRVVRALDLDQQVGRMRLAEGRLSARVPQHQPHPLVEEELPRQQPGELGTQLAEGRRRLVRVAHRQERDRAPRQPPDKPEAHRGDDAQRPLAAREERREVVPRVVLHHPRQAAHHAAVGEDRLHTHQLRAHRSVAERLDSAGVGRHHAADGRAVAGAQVDTDIQSARTDRVLHRRQGGARAHRHLAAALVKRLDLAQAEKTHHHLWICR